MSDRNSSTQSGILLTARQARDREQARGAWRQVLSPSALGLLALALTVALWGYGYKVSQCCAPSSESTPKIQSAKLWIEHRFGSAEVSSSAAASVKGRVYAEQGAFALLTAGPSWFFRGASRTILVKARPRAIPFFHSAIPLRSPPAPISL